MGVGWIGGLIGRRMERLSKGGSARWEGSAEGSARVPMSEARSAPEMAATLPRSLSATAAAVTTQTRASVSPRLSRSLGSGWPARPRAPSRSPWKAMG